MSGRPKRGEIWLGILDPVRGHEQGGVRPCLVLSDDRFNEGLSELTIIVPLTSKQKDIAYHVHITKKQSGLSKDSFAKCEDIRSVAIERLQKRVGNTHPSCMKEIERKTRMILGLR